MRHLLLLIISSFVSVSVCAQAAPVQDATYLFLMSRKIRKKSPTPEEYEGLRKASNKQKYLDAALSRYLKSEEHRQRMVFRLAERFSMPTPTSVVSETENRSSYYKSGDDENALSLLFYKMAKENLSWDTLLTGKSYSLVDGNNYFGDLSDFNFMELYLDEPLDRTGNSRKPRKQLSFDHDDPRIAGAITTSRFFQRYSSNTTNKNRGRASAVFRIFLCDSMSPAIPFSKNRKEAALASLIETQENINEQSLEKELSLSRIEDQHGTDSRCMVCHYKLDPMAKLFNASTLQLNLIPSGGRLVYTRTNGESVNIRARGLGDMARAVVKQPEYIECQIRYLWNEFIGVDVPLSPARLVELAQDFERVGRRTNDFIAVLLKSPEFRTPPVKHEEVIISQVRPLLQRCDRCHSGPDVLGEGYYIPSLSDIDVRQKDEKDLELLKLSTERVNRHPGDRKRMPQDWKSWSDSDLKALRDWFAGGARNDRREPLLQNTGGGK